jgi:hypothetical protein
MRLTRKLLAMSVLVSVLLASCASAPAASPATQVLPAQEELEPAATDTAVTTVDATAVLPTGTAEPAAAPEATSRGPGLAATDPESVRLDSGGLQLVEIFSFT